MKTARLSSNGQIVIPISVRTSHQWHTGQEFIIEEHNDGICLRPQKRFPKTSIAEVAGCLKYDGPSISIEEMNQSIAEQLRK